MGHVVRVHAGHEGGVGMGGRGSQGGDDSLGRLADDDDAGIPSGGAIGGAVGRAVVDEDQPPVAEGLAPERADRAGEGLPAVPDRKPGVDARQKYPLIGTAANVIITGR